MRRFLCLLKNRLERLAIYSLLKKFVLIGFLTVPLSFLLSSNASAASISSINNLQSTDINISGGMTTETSTNYGTVNLPWVHQNTNLTSQWYLRNVQGRVDLGGTLTGSYFQGDVTIGINAYGVLINNYSCDGIDADLFPYGVTVRDRTIQIVSCSIDQSSTSPIHRTLYVRLRVAGSFHASTSFTSFYFSITNASHFLAGCGFDDSSFCSSSDYWGIGSSIQAWDASEDPSLGYLSEINVSINNINDSINQQIEQDQQDRDDISQSKDDADATAEDLSQDIDNASSSLLTIIGNFVNVIINPPQRDCVINGDMGHMNLGQIDLCQLSLPSSFQIISTLLMIGFIIPFAYSLISTFLSLLKGATQD